MILINSLFIIDETDSSLNAEKRLPVYKFDFDFVLKTKIGTSKWWSL
jgi:hypothetical protein